jgi:hypothetical protein
MTELLQYSAYRGRSDQIGFMLMFGNISQLFILPMLNTTCLHSCQNEKTTYNGAEDLHTILVKRLLALY